MIESVIVEKEVGMNLCLILYGCLGRVVGTYTLYFLDFVCEVGSRVEFTEERWVQETNCWLTFVMLLPA